MAVRTRGGGALAEGLAGGLEVSEIAQRVAENAVGGALVLRPRHVVAQDRDGLAPLLSLEVLVCEHQERRRVRGVFLRHVFGGRGAGVEHARGGRGRFKWAASRSSAF